MIAWSRTASVMQSVSLRGFSSRSGGTIPAMASSVERKAENEAIFRDANERIAAVRSDLSRVEGKTPFFCECDDPDCREIVRLDVDEYESIREHPKRFLIKRGHETEPDDEVVTERETYVVVEKTGAAGRVAVETDPRGSGG